MKLPNAVAIAEDVHGNIWVAGTSQVLCWHEGSFKSYLREQLAPLGLASGVESVVAASDGSVWAAVPGVESLALVHIINGLAKPVLLSGLKTQSFTNLF